MPDRQNTKDASHALGDHPVAKAIDTLIHHARDIEDCDRHFVPIADVQKRKELHDAVNELETAVTGLSGHPPSPAHGAALRRLLTAGRRLERAIHAERATVLRSSLFLGLFSAYDSFCGDLIRALFQIKPALFAAVGGTVPVVDVLAADSIGDIKHAVLYDYIEDFRRKSYVDQFEVLEKLFDIKLRQFERWPRFVEASQRRNLVAHCGGVVSEQYLIVCKREDAAVNDVVVGAQLDLQSNYFAEVCRLVAEVALKLGQTLWRKISPEGTELADRHLHHVSYEALQFEEWAWSALVSDFALGQRKLASEQNRLIAVVNHAIALKFGGDASAAQRLLDGVDWSATSPEFKLASAVLRDDFEEAAQIMARIGKRGELIDDSSYHDWPLFREFRETPQFQQTYEQVYGRTFTDDVRKTLAQAEANIPLLESKNGDDVTSSAHETLAANASDSSSGE